MVQRIHNALLTRARRGDEAAQFELGTMYLQGTVGLAANATMARDWLLKAALSDHEPARSAIIRACSLDAGESTAETQTQMTALLREEAKKGDPIAQWTFVRHVERLDDADETLLQDVRRCVVELADGGHRAAQWRLARILSSEGKQEGARRWALRAAQSGENSALLWLLETTGPTRDEVSGALLLRSVQRLLSSKRGIDQIAAKLFFIHWRQGLGHLSVRLAALTAAAQQGLASAQFELGLSYLSAAQLAKNRVNEIQLTAIKRILTHAALPLFQSPQLSVAARWLTAAAGQGQADAAFVLAVVLRLTALAERSVEQSDAWFERAAHLGQVDAQFFLGNALWRRRESAPGAELAGLRWLAQASAQGSQAAKEMLARVTDASSGPGADSTFRHVSDEVLAELETTDPLLASRMAIGRGFGLSRLEALLLNLQQADAGDFLIVDLSSITPRHKRRIVRIGSAAERRLLEQAGERLKAIRPGDEAIEGNYRQRLYRCNRVLESVAPAAGARKKERSKSHE